MTQSSTTITTSDELRLLYFEGPDGAGKTTRIKEFRNDFDFYWHNGVYPSLDHSYRAYSHQIATLEVDQFHTGILDRGIFSDYIYGSVCRGVQPAQHNIEALCYRMREIGTKLIICLPPYEVCKQNWLSRIGKEYVKDDVQYGCIYDKYVELIDNALLPTEIYDYTGIYPHGRQSE